MASNWSVGDDLLSEGLKALNTQNETVEGVALDRSAAQVLVLAELVKEIRLVSEDLRSLEHTLAGLRQDLEIRDAMGR